MNFGKDLREFSDDELYKKINNDDCQLVHLYSQELTRRSNDRWSQKIAALTVVLIFIGLTQLLISLVDVSKSWKIGIALMDTILLLVVFIMRLGMPKKSKK